MLNQSIDKHLYALILCGEGGSRLWPLTSKSTPKQFHKLLDSRSTFQYTVDRLKHLLPIDRIYVISDSEEYVDIISHQAPKLPRSNIIVEPIKRSTAWANALGTAYIHSQDPESMIVSTGSDQMVKDAIAFKESLIDASTLCLKFNSIVAIGIKPLHPYTGYGYIEAGSPQKLNNINFYKIKNFQEKPSFATAQRFTYSKNHYWNANVYIWNAKVYLSSFEKHLPRESRGLKRIISSIGTKDEKSTLKSVYQMASSSSFEESIASKEKKMLMLEGKFGWADVSNWKEIWDHSPKDIHKNALLVGKKNKIVTINSRGNLIKTNKLNIGIIGLEDLVIVETSDSLLVCHKLQVEYVRQLLEDKTLI